MPIASPARRLLQGLSCGSGRTLVIAGPPLSGKSELLEQIRAEVARVGGRVHNLRGEYRSRDTAFAAMETLDHLAPEVAAAEPSSEAEAEMPTGPFAYLPVDPESAPLGRRRGERPRGTTPLFGGPSRSRGAVRVDPEEFWHRMVEDTRGEGPLPVLVCVDEAVFVDAESREVLLYLSERARLRPVGLVLSLDSSVAAFASWEERLLGHGDVDWLRLTHAVDDPRDVRRVRELFEELPEGSRRILGLTALIGGEVREVTLSRVARLTFPQLADALLPAVEAQLVKVEDGKILFAHATYAHQVPEMIPVTERSEMHREIAEALAALNPEPSLDRRLELSHHYYEWYRGPNALRYLLETAELTERLHAYDTACEALGKARECVPSLPAADRWEAEAEIRLLEFRALAFAGRLDEAELALHEGIAAAIEGAIAPERLEDWMEASVPVLECLGPKPSMATQIVELAERCHGAGIRAAETLLQSVLALYDLDRGRPVKGKAEARRGAIIARETNPGPAQALAMLAVGRSLIEGTAEEQRLAERFLISADRVLGRTRRAGFQLEAEEALLRLREVRGEREVARRAREKAIQSALRLRNLPVELAHQLGLAALLLEQNADARAAGTLLRAREIVETLHLVPPSPFLLKLWLLEGRYHAETHAPREARDRWEAIAEQPPGATAPRLRAEARLRLAILEATTGRDDALEEHLRHLAEPELDAALRPEWREWLAPLVRRSRAQAAPSTEKAPGSTA